MSEPKNASKILILFAHPAQNHAKANMAMMAQAKALENVTFVDLYAEYPRFKINVDAEQQRLLEHDIIIFQFPIYWYSTPAILKEWQDLVFEYGFAFGQDGNKLAGKKFFCAVTAAGDELRYSDSGGNEHGLRDFLLPIEQSIKLCQMDLLPPFVLYGSLAAQQGNEIAEHAMLYGQMLTAMRDNQFDYSDMSSREFINQSALPIKQQVAS